MTRNQFIAKSVLALEVARLRTDQVPNVSDSIRRARQIADKLEQDGVAPWAPAISKTATDVKEASDFVVTPSTFKVFNP